MTTGGGTGAAANGQMTLAGLLRSLRERALLTQEELACRSGVSARTIRDLETGRVRAPRGATVRLLAEALGVTGEERAALTASTYAGPGRARGTREGLVPAQLPAGPAGFTGRAGSLAALDALLPAAAEQGAAPTTVVISAIGGAPGVGKTALALHWAHRVAGRFGDGQLFVSLHGYAPGPPVSPMQALARLLHSLGVADGKIPVEVDEAAGLYRSLLAGKRLLIVLDNARDAEQVRPLLPGGPGCVVVVTSRDRLTGLTATHDARRLTLDVLSAGEAVGLLARVVGEERVAAEPEAAQELAELCGHLPLALRIVAANLTCGPPQTLAGYAARLRAGDRLAGLTVVDDPRVAVRAAFEASYDGRNRDAQRLFRLLGLVPGPEVGAAAAAALAATTPDRAERLLESLAAAHLVEPRGQGRFGFHDLLRLYARERAEQEEGGGQRRAAMGRLLAWYLHGADAAVGLLCPGMLRLPVPAAEPSSTPAGFDDRSGALAWLRTEWGNLVAAVTGTAGPGHRRLVWLLADTLRSFCWTHHNTVDWLAIAAAGLAAARHDGDLRAQAAAELSLGDAHQCSGRYPQAIEHYITALDLARRAGWQAGQAAILGNLAVVHGNLGDLPQAVEHHTTALDLYRAAGDLRGQAACLGNLGNLHRELGDLQAAADCLHQALALYRQVGARGSEANPLGSLGEVAHALGRPGQAIEYLTAALALLREVGDRHGEAYALGCLAAVHADTGRHAQALDLTRAALALVGEIDDPRCEAEVRIFLGGVHLRLGRPDQALDHHRRALVLARQAGSRYPETGAQLGLAACHQARGQLDTALDQAEQALAVAGQAGYQVLEGQARTELAAVHLARGNPKLAAEQARLALAIQRATGHRLGHARSLAVLGHALRHVGAAAAALPCWQEAFELFTEVGSPDAAELRGLLPSLPAGARERR